jgi:hypothetical protein
MFQQETGYGDPAKANLVFLILWTWMTDTVTRVMGGNVTPVVAPPLPAHLCECSAVCAITIEVERCWPNLSFFLTGVGTRPHSNEYAPHTLYIPPPPPPPQVNPSCSPGYLSSSLKGLSHEMDLAFDDMYG